MASTYHYRLHKSSWGIAIDLTAETITNTGGVQQVADNLYLRVDASVKLSVEELAYLVQGLRLVANQFQSISTSSEPIVVRVLALEYNPCDYQPEGLAYAMMGWAAQEYGFEPPAIQVVFNRQLNRYEFLI